MISFQLIGLPMEPFSALFGLSDHALTARRVKRVFADEKPGFPCRVSLEDAEVGEELLLLPFAHQAAESPYRACGPIFVRKAAQRRVAEPDSVPGYVSTRLMSVRAYDASHLMIDADVCEGRGVADVIRGMFGQTGTSYIHLHNAKRGCFSCRVNRV